MDEDALIGQIGLLLTQLRYVRRALEDIERSTARYASLSIAAADRTTTVPSSAPITPVAVK